MSSGDREESKIAAYAGIDGEIVFGMTYRNQIVRNLSNVQSASDSGLSGGCRMANGLRRGSFPAVTVKVDTTPKIIFDFSF